MNKYSLRFLNELTEKNYQIQQDEMLYQTVKKIATFIILTIITMIITLSLNNQIPECILAIIFGFTIIIGVYILKKKPQYRRTIPLLFQFISLISSTAPWIKHFVVGMSQSDFVLSDLCTLGSLTFNTVTNFKQNCVKHLYFIVSRSIWHFFIGYSPYNVVYIVFSIILLYNDYYRVFMQRQYYLTSQEKKIQNNILDTFCKEKIMITQYGQENQRFQTILVNQSLREMLGLSDANEILKIIQLKFKQDSNYQSKKQKCLQTYLFEDYLSLKDHFPLLQETTTIKLEGRVNDIKINIDIMVQNFLEKIFIIRLERIPNCVSNNSAALYKSFFKSVLKAGQSVKMTKIISEQVYKNIILSLRMNDEAKYTVKLQMIDIVKIFQNLEYHCIYKIRATQMLQSDPLLFSSLIYLIGKVCQYRFVYMENLDYKFTLTLLGKFRNIQLYKNRNFHLSTEKLTNKLNIDRIIYREHEGLICVQLIIYQFQ